MGMHNNPILHTFHYLPNDHGTPDPLPSVHCGSRNEEADSEADALRGHTEYIFDSPRLMQDSPPPNASAESVDWGIIPAWILGMTNPSSQEVPEDTSMFDAAPGTYPPYSGSYFDQDLPPAASEPVCQTMGQPVLSYPVRQMAGTLADIGLLSFTAEMERQSTHEMTYTDRSSSRASSALDRDGLAGWSGPGHAPSSSDHRDLISPGLLSNPLEGPSPCRSIESIPENGEATPNLWLADGGPTIIPELGPAIITSLQPQGITINLLEIPQRTYIQRGGDRRFPQSGEITFSVDGTRGFNIQNALRQHFTGLDGRDDFVLETANGPVSCRLLFPGYPINRSTQIAVRTWRKKSTPITRSKLAYEIAKRVERYLDILVTTPIDSSVDPRWTIGRDCMRLEKMYLVSVAWVSRGSLQPEIWVDNSS